MDFADFLITTDYDATLTGPDGTIPQRNLDAIRYFMEQGGAFTVNTGRSGVFARELMQVVPVNAPFLLMNGSAMVENGKTLELHTIDLDPWQVMLQLQEAFPGLVTEVQDNDFHYLQNPSQQKLERYAKMGWTYKLVQPGDDVGPFAKFNVWPSEQALLEAKRQAGRLLWLNPIPESKWKYIRSVQTMASICPMISCSTLRELAAACRRLAQS